MRSIPAFLFLAALTNCSQKENKIIPKVQVSKISEIASINYDSCKTVILLNKKNQKARWPFISKQEKEKIFASAVTETIIPAWIGTTWDFNGTSEKPKQGSIACGYFVTTILRDAGLSLARVKLAQCASEQMITSLVQSKYIHRFSNATMENFIQSIKDQGYGLYIVGLDNHTGFIYNDGKEIWFIHSTFIAPRKVQKENAAANWILEKSNYKILGKISADEKVLNRWMN
jgi:hypothetical protein